MSNKTNTTTNSNSSSTKKSSAATAAAHPKHDPPPPLWELPAGPVLDAWLSRTLQQAVDNVQKSSSSSSKSSSNNNMNTKQQQQQITPETVALWLQHIVSSVQAIELKEAPSPPPPAATAAAEDDDDRMNEEEEQEQRPAKRARFARTKKKPKIILELQDPYHIWWITKYTQKPVDITDTNDYEDLPDVLGGRLAQLSVGAWLNALLQFPLVHKAHPTTAVVLKTCLQQQLLQQQAAPPAAPAPAPPAPFVNYQTYVLETWHVATEMHRLVQNTVQSDIWRTTPSRIQEYLAPDVTLAEFESIRKRVYETVILGKGLHTSTTTTKDDDDDEWAAAQNGDIPVAPGLLMQHDVEKYKKCPSCGNQDQATFALDRKNGDIICSNCGVVVSESLMHEGSAYRKFEGEADRNHHGDAANPLYSNAHNMSTTLSGIAPMSSGIEGYAGGAGSKGGSLEAILRNAHAWTELNLSQLGTKNNKDRRTRIGYKDRQKKEAFVQMTHTGDALHLHEAVVQRAKELFAGFRDDRELVQQFKGVLAACLCEAFEQLSRDESGRMLIKGVGGNELQQQQEQQQHEAAASAEEEEEEKPIKLSARAQRRQDLHHATLAGKGGLLLDFSNVRSSTAAKVGGTDNAEVATSTAATSPTDPVATAAAAAPEQSKPAASWDLDDCRSWLLGASRRIAQQWVKERQEAVNKEAAAKFPAGPLEELEGMLVEHSIVLCEELEQELHSRNSNGNSSNGNAVKLQKNRVVTPRVQDMSKLGIQWQHAHERGSGGKGGIGGSGTAVKKAAAVTAKVAANQKGGRTAGQVLLLKSAKKLGTLLNDPLAGEAIHRELRAVIAKQETQKRQKMLEEASRQRFLQMKRKPWLQARAQIES